MLGLCVNLRESEVGTIRANRILWLNNTSHTHTNYTRCEDWSDTYTRCVEFAYSIYRYIFVYVIFGIYGIHGELWVCRCGDYTGFRFRSDSIQPLAAHAHYSALYRYICAVNNSAFFASGFWCSGAGTASSSLWWQRSRRIANVSAKTTNWIRIKSVLDQPLYIRI